MSTIDEIMSQAQEFASGWELMGTRFDSGNGYADAIKSKDRLCAIITAALAEARREGAEQMREAAAQSVKGIGIPGWIEDASFRVSAISLPTGPRQAVRLTDEQIGTEMFRAGNETIHGFARAIETAVFAANGLEMK